MIVHLPRDLYIDIDNIPEDFELQVQQKFAEYTEGTHPDYMFQDKLAFIDLTVKRLHGDKDSQEAVMDLMKDTFEFNVKEYGDFPGESDFLSVEFMEQCYTTGKESQRLHSHFETEEHHIYEKIEKLLLRLIQAVLDYKKEG